MVISLYSFSINTHKNSLKLQVFLENLETMYIDVTPLTCSYKSQNETATLCALKSLVQDSLKLFDGKV